LAVFDARLLREAQERSRIAVELRNALPAGQLAVYYQPEINLLDGSVPAVEALLRWRHPSGELYSAGRFIDVAAQTGLIVDIGHWVFDQVCSSAAQWTDRGLLVRVNFAPRQLATPDLLTHIDASLERHSLPPERLCVEITEQTLLVDNPTVRDNLERLSERGIATAIDDFGTGYASLSYLHRYPVDTIKIDRSFVIDVANDARAKSVADAIVALAERLDLSVVAEGVEDPEQASTLLGVGCRRAQGFLWSEAVPPDAIPDIAQSGYSPAERPSSS
jgi:EAL domain-containing protein (putative c-di-GMP-specific phosphodiesterase class I)